MPENTRSYLGRLADEADKLFRGQTIEQFAAICFRRQPENRVEVLLITSRESRRWVVPKGWAIGGMAPHEVAEHEAWEEAGVKGKAKKRPFGFYTYLKVLDTGDQVPSIVQVHLVETRKIEERFPERGERTAQWLPPYEAAALVREPELKSLLRGVEKAVLAPETLKKKRLRK